MNKEEQLRFAAFLHQLAKIARSEDRIAAKLARQCIIQTLWRWTADAIETRSGKLTQDRYKYCDEAHHCTAAASKKLNMGTTKTLCHEHAIPRKYLARLLLKYGKDEWEILQLMKRNCIAVISTKEESKQLRKDSMPDRWDRRRGDPYARYKEKGIKLIAPKQRGT